MIHRGEEGFLRHLLSKYNVFGLCELHVVIFAHSSKDELPVLMSVDYKKVLLKFKLCASNFLPDCRVFPFFRRHDIKAPYVDACCFKVEDFRSLVEVKLVLINIALEKISLRDSISG